jgi:hypothetical protein
MTMKPIQISGHARFEMARRGITDAEVEAVMRSPGQVLPAKKGRQVFQSKVGSAGHLLLRVVVKDEPAGYAVISAYLTNKVAKYWKQT